MWAAAMDEAIPIDLREDLIELPTTSIYHGRELKGFYVVLETGEFVAFDRFSAPLGAFRKAKDARQAIVAAWERIP